MPRAWARQRWFALFICASSVCHLSACSPAGDTAPLPLRVREAEPISSEPARLRGPRPPPVLQNPGLASAPANATGTGTSGSDGVIGATGAPPIAPGSAGTPGATGTAGSTGGAAGAGGGPMSSGPIAGGPAPSGGSLGCASLAPLASGSRTLNVGAASRRYELVVPSGASGPLPVLVALHGFGMTPAGMAAVTGLSELAEREGVIVAYPEGGGDPASWNAGNCCAFDDETRDDVLFIESLLDELESGLCVDPRRVYATGFSNGGMLAYRLACELSERIAAVASVAGTIAVPLAQCNPARPVPILHAHGTADALVPFQGGRGPALIASLGAIPPNFPSVLLQMLAFIGINGCGVASDTVFQRGDTTCERRTDCAAGATLELCTILGGGHAWPGDVSLPPPVAFGGIRSQTLPMTDTIWEFLSEHASSAPATP